jgi:hypothetical protein
MGLELMIDGKVCTLPKEELEKLAFNFAIYDNKALGNIKGASTTRTVKLPADGNNTLIFGQYGVVSNGLITQQLELSCSIKISGLPILTGKAYLAGVEFGAGLRQLLPKSYEVLIIGENADFFTAVRGLLLRQVISEPPHQQTATLMTDGLAADYDAGNKYGYLIAQYRLFNNINYVTAGELTPFYFTKALLDDICASVGYTLKSDFFNTAGFKRLTYPLFPIQEYSPEFSVDYLNIAAQISAPVPYPDFLTLYLPFDQQTQAPTGLGAVNPYSTTTYTYTVPQKGFYRVVSVVRFAWDGIGGNSQIEMAVVKNLDITPPVTGGVRSATNIQDGDTLKSEYVFDCVAGDTLTVLLAGLIGAHDGLSLESATLTVTGTAVYEYGSPTNFVNLGYMAGSVTVFDFIKGLTGLFNLAWQADAVSRVLVCEPKDSYILNDPETGAQSLENGFYLGSPADFNPKIDLSQSADMSNGIGDAVRVIMNMREDTADFYITAANEQVTDGQNAGGGRYEPPTKAEKDIEIIENPLFAATAHRYADELTIDAPDGSRVRAQVPILFNDDNPNVVGAFLPRCWYFRPYGSTRKDGYIKYEDPVLGVVARQHQPAFAVNGNDIGGRDWVLQYGSEPNSTIAVGLMAAYYRRELGRLLLGNSLSLFAFFTHAEINQLNFREKLRIAQGLFILTAVKGYQPATSGSTSTQIEAIQDNLNPPDYFLNNQPTTLNLAIL